MEKVKLPKKICEVLNNYKYLGDKEILVWSAIQSPDLNKNHTLQPVREYANNKNTLKVINAILYGYEPEETEEERKERELKDSLIDYFKKNKHVYSTIENVAEDILDLIKK